MFDFAETQVIHCKNEEEENRERFADSATPMKSHWYRSNWVINYCIIVQNSVQFSRSVISDSFHPMDYSIPTPGAYSNSCSSSQWCHPTISSSVVPFSSQSQSSPASSPGSLQMSQFFTSGGQSIAVSASASVLPMNTLVWSPLGWTGWISLKSQGLSRVFSNTIVQKHQFFSTQLSFIVLNSSLYMLIYLHMFSSELLFMGFSRQEYWNGLPFPESRLLGKISITSDMQMTPPLWQKVKKI